MNIFGQGYRRTRQLKAEIISLEEERDKIIDENRKAKEALLDENRKLKDDIADLRQKKKMEDENIRHLVKIKEESLDIAHERKTVELERKQQDAIATVKDKYREKQESTLQKQIEDGKQMYSEILARLPNVNVRLKGDA